ncbi:MAG: DMT family transporter [Desulfosarcina sp.]|nr:DMT family transporter [Desulfobacterales bacterium]
MPRITLYGFMALHVGLASASYIFGKAAAVGFDDPAVLTLARALGAAVIFLLVTGTLIPRPRFSPREWLYLGGLGFLLVLCNQYCFLRGLQHTVPSHPALFYALTPLGVLVLDSLMGGQRPHRAKVTGVGLALGGVVLILRPWDGGAAFNQIRIGDYWIMGAVLSWVIYTVAVRPLCRRHDPRTVTAWSLIIGAALMLPVAGRDLMARPLADIPVNVWMSLAWLTVITSVVMMLLWNVLLHDLTSVEVAVCTNAQPPTTALLTAVLAAMGFLDRQQDLGLLFITGMLLVLGGVFLVQRRPS